MCPLLMRATCAFDSKKQRTEDRKRRTDGEVSRWWARDKGNCKKYLFFSIFGETYLREFDKQTFVWRADLSPEYEPLTAESAKGAGAQVHKAKVKKATGEAGDQGVGIRIAGEQEGCAKGTRAQGEPPGAGGPAEIIIGQYLSITGIAIRQKTLRAQIH